MCIYIYTRHSGPPSLGPDRTDSGPRYSPGSRLGVKTGTPRSAVYAINRIGFASYVRTSSSMLKTLSACHQKYERVGSIRFNHMWSYQTSNSSDRSLHLIPLSAHFSVRLIYSCMSSSLSSSLRSLASQLASGSHRAAQPLSLLDCTVRYPIILSLAGPVTLVSEARSTSRESA